MKKTQGSVRPFVALIVMLLAIGLTSFAVSIPTHVQNRASESSTLVASTTNVVSNMIKNYSSASGLTMNPAFTITNTGSTGTTWQLKNNQDGTYTPPGGTPSPTLIQGFGFYESSGGLQAGGKTDIHIYVNNNKPAGQYQGSYTLQQVSSSTTTDVAKITFSLTVREPNKAPLASFSFSQIPVTQKSSTSSTFKVAFSNSSTDPNGDVLTYLWNFGDGTTSTEKNPTHTYFYPKNVSSLLYNVSLTAKDTSGATGTGTKQIKLYRNIGPGE